MCRLFFGGYIMIYIDTRDQLSLKHGVMEFLNVTEEELELVFETIDSVDEDPEYHGSTIFL